MIYLIDIVGYYKLYKELNRQPIDSLEILDLMDDLLINFKGISSLTMLEQSEYEVDDTTTKAFSDMVFDMSKLVPYMERLTYEYNRISLSELELFRKTMIEILVSSAIVLYKSFGIADFIESVLVDGSITLGNKVMDKRLMYIISEYHISLEQYTYLVCMIMKDFKPFLPEYALNEEQLSVLFNFVDNSDNYLTITQLTKNEIGDLLREGY